MPARKHLKVLSVRMAEPELRRLKSIAANRGISVQDAVHEALEAWAAQPARTHSGELEALEGSLADVDIQTLMRSEKESRGAEKGPALVLKWSKLSSTPGPSWRGLRVSSPQVSTFGSCLTLLVSETERSS